MYLPLFLLPWFVFGSPYFLIIRVIFVIWSVVLFIICNCHDYDTMLQRYDPTPFFQDVDPPLDHLLYQFQLPFAKYEDIILPVLCDDPGP